MTFTFTDEQADRFVTAFENMGENFGKLVAMAERAYAAEFGEDTPAVPQQGPLVPGQIHMFRLSQSCSCGSRMAYMGNTREAKCQRCDTTLATLA